MYITLHPVETRLGGRKLNWRWDLMILVAVVSIWASDSMEEMWFFSESGPPGQESHMASVFSVVTARALKTCLLEPVLHFRVAYSKRGTRSISEFFALALAKSRLWTSSQTSSCVRVVPERGKPTMKTSLLRTWKL
jgi:hypothetical protein